MLKKDFDLFKQKYIKNCKTESSSSAVLKLYSYILQNENSDSDYWTEGSGNNDVVKILENYFSENNWKELENDLDNWTTFQLEIFTECILEGTGYEDDDKEFSTIENRFILLLKLLKIAKERGINKNQISVGLSKNIEFLDKCHKITIENITEIAKCLNYFNRNTLETNNEDITMLTIKRIFEKASS
jgi:hypothetical protein